MADVSGLVEAVEFAAELMVTAAADAVLEATRTAAPVGETGATRDSLKVERLSPTSVEISADTPQAQFTDEGTQGPYIIRGNPNLAFFWPNGPQGAGDYVYRFVTHPGIKAQNWFAEPMAGRWEEALLDAAVDEVSG